MMALYLSFFNVFREVILILVETPGTGVAWLFFKRCPVSSLWLEDDNYFGNCLVLFSQMPTHLHCRNDVASLSYYTKEKNLNAVCNFFLLSSANNVSSN